MVIVIDANLLVYVSGSGFVRFSGVHPLRSA